MALDGGIDILDRHGLHGWAYDRDDPAPVELAVHVTDRAPLRLLANLHRSDLEQAGIGDGRHGFSLALEGLSPLVPHTVRVARASDGTDLPGSPRTIPASPGIDQGLQDHLARLLAGAEGEDVQRHWAAFLAGQADRLLQRAADRRSRRPPASAPQMFRVRWSGRGAPSPAPMPRALVIDDKLPREDRDAGSRAVMSHVRSLQRLGYAVTFAAADMLGGEGADALEAEGVACCCAPWCGSVEEALRREADSFAVIYVHRGGNARYLPLLRHCQRRARVVLSMADLHHLRLARQADVEGRPELLDASKRMRMGELSAAAAADRVITHSTHEAALLRQAVPQARIHVVPWTVAPCPTPASFAERRGLAFIGSYPHPPNLDAAWWLLQDVMPLVRERCPAITCALAGSDMPDSLRAAAGPGVAMLGHVPDLAALFGQVRLTAAPLTFGAGVKGKVLDSLAHGVPCACTPVAVEGMELPAALDATVGATAADLADIICRLHEDAGFNAACREAGLGYVRERLAEAAVDAAMREVVGARS